MDVTERNVSWGTVIGGIVVALIAGFVVTIFSTLGGMFLFDQVHSKAAGVLVAAGVPAALMALLYLVTRRGSPDFARGIIIGGCLVLLWSSACGLNMVGARFAG